MSTANNSAPSLKKQGWTISILFSGLLLLVLFFNLDFQTLANLVSQLQPLWLLPAAGMYFLAFWTRGLRYRNLLGSDDQEGRTFLHLSLMHHFYLLILPAKAGELIFPWLCHSILNSARTLNMLVLLIVRLFDFFFVFLFISLGLFATLLPDAPRLLIFGAALLAVGFLLLGVRSQLIVHAILKSLGFLMRQRVGARFFGRVNSQLQAAESFLEHRRDLKKQLWLFFWTMASWVVSTFGLWAMFRAFGVAVEPAVAVFLLGGMHVVSIFGFFSLGGLGIMELGLAGMLMSLGYETQTAIALGLGVRLGLVLTSLAAIAVAETMLALITSRRRD